MGLTHFSLFTGIGGLDLAAEWAGFETVGQCEWADYPTKVLEKHWPDVPKWRDIRSVTGDDIRAKGIKEITVLSGASRVNRTALQECVKRLVMNVICGRNIKGSLMRLNQDGLWLKMYGDCLQVKMDGSFEEYLGICPNWGLMLDGVVFQPHGLEPYIDESEFSLLPTPTAEQFSLWESAKIMCSEKKKRKSGVKIGTSLSWIMAKWHLQNGGCPEGIPNPLFAEKVMGFPIGWTDGTASETQ
jgi:hypothetical protein